MIEKTIQDLTDAVKGLTEQLKIQNELLANSVSQIQPHLTIFPKIPAVNSEGTPLPSQEELDDRGLPAAKEKPKRTRKKKEADFTPEQLAAIEAEEKKFQEEESNEEDSLPATVLTPPEEMKGEEKTVKSYTAEDARDALKAYSNKHKEYSSCLTLLKQFGVERLCDMKPADYKGFIELSQKGKIENVLKTKK